MATKHVIYTIYPEHCGFKAHSAEAWGDTLASFLDLYREEIQYCCFQIEIGDETAHEHCQLFVQWKKRQRPDRLQRILGLGGRAVHWNGQRFGTAQAMRNYCVKEDGRVAGPWELGEFIGPQPGARSDIRSFATGITEGVDIRLLATRRPDVYVKYHRGFQALKELLDEPSLEPIEREVIVVYGATGAGKTHWIKEDCKNRFGRAYQVPLNFNGQAFWFDGYRDHEAVIIDDFNGQVPIQALLRILHGWEERVPVKGAHVVFRPKAVYISANKPWEEWYPQLSPNDEHWKALQRRITRVLRFDVPAINDSSLLVAEVARDNTSLSGNHEELMQDMELDDMSADELLQTIGYEKFLDYVKDN